MRDLSVVIPARNEQFLQRTIQDVLENSQADTEVIAVCDGNWPDPPVLDHPKVTIVHVSEPIGQRAATNLGVRISQAKYVMKLDAHCALGKGFDRILIESHEPGWVMVPAQYALHIFNWRCLSCKNETYQGTRPVSCAECKGTEFDMVMVWARRDGRLTIGWRFDSDLNFQYWRRYVRRPEAQGTVIPTMSCIGACVFWEREHFLAMDGMDERHGSWGNFGTEAACKAWLSGGQLMVTKNTWFAHLFRTGNFRGSGYMGSSFPYPLSGNDQERAKAYSRDFWRKGKWDKAVHPLSWLVERFWPVDGWTETDLKELKNGIHSGGTIYGR